MGTNVAGQALWIAGQAGNNLSPHLDPRQIAQAKIGPLDAETAKNDLGVDLAIAANHGVFLVCEACAVNDKLCVLIWLHLHKGNALIPAVLDHRCQADGGKAAGDIARRNLMPARARIPPFQKIVGKELHMRLHCFRGNQIGGCRLRESGDGK